MTFLSDIAKGLFLAALGAIGMAALAWWLL